MMPDKVYLEEGCSVPVVGFVSPSWNNPKDKENTVEYIRKNALLEWLEDMRFMANSERAGAYQNVIDKLNSM